MLYRVNEIFYSLQGEGMHSGKAFTFIRMAGCNLKCSFCDTEHDEHKIMTMEDILKEVLRHKARRVIITGGEPLMQNLEPLCNILHQHAFFIHLETNGTYMLPNYREMFFDWITVSPKGINFIPEVVRQADEVKCLCGMKDWKVICSFARVNARPGTPLYLMPVDEKTGSITIRKMESKTWANTLLAVEYCLENPAWQLCLQIHKILSIK